MALHIRSLKIKSFSLPHVLTRCFATQAQNSNIGDRRIVTDIDLESFANELSSACEEARKKVSLLPSLPTGSRLADLLSESQKLIEAVNKHVLITSLSQAANSKNDLSLGHQNCPSWSRLKGQISARDHPLPVKRDTLESEKKTLEENQRIRAEQCLTETFQGFRSFVQPYSHTSDDIIIRSGRLIDQAQLFGEKLNDVASIELHVPQNKKNATGFEISFQNERLPSWPLKAHHILKHNDLLSQESLLLCALPSTSEQSESPLTPNQSPAPQKGGPNEEQLAKFQNYISKALIRFFVVRHDYGMYHPDIIFENNFWGTNLITNGLNAYAVQLNKLRILSHLKFAYTEVQILKCTMHPEDGTVRVRWRVKGLSQFKALMFWKFLPWKYRKTLKDESTWYDGMSVYHMGSDGLVNKHRVDRVMPDEETEVAKQANLAVKLSILLGLVPKPGLNDFASLFCRRSAPSSALPQQQ